MIDTESNKNISHRTMAGELADCIGITSGSQAMGVPDVHKSNDSFSMLILDPRQNNNQSDAGSQSDLMKAVDF